jgi:predicted nucleic acid-binding protein
MGVGVNLDSFTEKLLNYRICGLDTMIFIYLFEGNPKYFPLVERAMKLLEKRKLKGVTSIVSPIEVLSAENLEMKPQKRKAYRDFFNKEKGLRTLELSWEIVDQSAFLRREYRLRVPDAIQLAVAQIYGADLFITNDDSFRKIKDFPILFLKDFVK